MNIIEYTEVVKNKLSNLTKDDLLKKVNNLKDNTDSISEININVSLDLLEKMLSKSEYDKLCDSL